MSCSVTGVAHLERRWSLTGMQVISLLPSATSMAMGSLIWQPRVLISLNLDSVQCSCPACAYCWAMETELSRVHEHLYRVSLPVHSRQGISTTGTTYLRLPRQTVEVLLAYCSTR